MVEEGWEVTIREFYKIAIDFHRGRGSGAVGDYYRNQS